MVIYNQYKYFPRKQDVMLYVWEKTAGDLLFPNTAPLLVFEQKGISVGICLVNEQSRQI